MGLEKNRTLLNPQRVNYLVNVALKVFLAVLLNILTFTTETWIFCLYDTDPLLHLLCPHIAFFGLNQLQLKCLTFFSKTFSLKTLLKVLIPPCFFR